MRFRDFRFAWGFLAGLLVLTGVSLVAPETEEASASHEKCADGAALRKAYSAGLADGRSEVKWGWEK